MSRRAAWGDTVLVWSLRAAAAVCGAVALLIALFLLSESLPALRDVALARFVTDRDWHPTEDGFGMVPMLAGTLLATVLSVAAATPIGLLSAVFCHYYAPRRVATLYRRLIELLAGIPSVVYGFWGLVVLVPLIGRFRPPGASLLAGTLILAVMILPTVALAADGALANVPRSYLQGAAALGLSRARTIATVVFPAAKSGLFTGVILETGRAIGETMALLMVCGNVVQVPKSIFDPMRTLAANIALEMAYATGTHRSALFVSGVLLMAVVAALIAAAETASRGKIYG